jgi:hypothetical protein
MSYNQISLSIFKYPWFKARYFYGHPGPFKSVIEVCFVFDNLECHMRNCVRCSFIWSNDCGYKYLLILCSTILIFSDYVRFIPFSYSIVIDKPVTENRSHGKK